VADTLPGFCGLDCATCPAFLAARRSTPEARAKWAAEWSTEAFPLTADDMDCHGCVGPDDQVIGFCRACPVRQCAMAKDLNTCAECAEHPCPKLKAKLAELGAS